ncbi:MAG: tyrosine-type recombinase/integrase [Myxococcales bacterium]|nr:tyrosine-type recombinase/integrase [Myxococcales bacterium]
MAESITNASLRALKPRAQAYEITDARLPGFVVRVLPSGKKVFFVRHRPRGRDERVRLGLWSDALSLDEARRQAMVILAGQPVGSSAAERDAEDEETDDVPPTHERTLDPDDRERSLEPASARRTSSPRRSREPLKSRRSQITVRDVAARFEREYIAVYLKPGSASNYRRHLQDHILPAFGDRPFDQISRADIKGLHASLSDRPALADYVVCVVGSLYSRIIDDWELADIRNPASGVRRFGSRRRERFLSPAERRAVLAELEAGLRVPPSRRGHIERFSAWAIRLLMLTGQRRDEILTLRWSMVDWQHSCIHFPDTKTGQRSVAISREVMALLREIHNATGSPKSGLVLRGRNGTKIAALNRTWSRIRERVGIPDVRLHDLRHSFASEALMAGVPLAIVGELLGHRQAATTQRYAHLADNVVRDALETATKRMLDASKADSCQPNEPHFIPLTDAQWSLVAPLVGAERHRAGPPVDLRRVVDGIRWVHERKARWHDLPAVFGTPTTCWRWHKRWSEDGTWALVSELTLPTAPPLPTVSG